MQLCIRMLFLRDRRGNGFAIYVACIGGVTNCHNTKLVYWLFMVECDSRLYGRPTVEENGIIRKADWTDYILYHAQVCVCVCV